MFNRKLKYGVILFLLALSLILGSIIFYSQKHQELQIIFLDVGQGDSILISRGSFQVLVDGGKNGKLLLNKIGKYIPFWDREIEVVLATHPDQDHISGLINVLEEYSVGTIIRTEDANDTQTFKKFMENVNNEKAENISAKKGVKIIFSEGVEMEIIYPFFEIGNIADNQSNSGSIVSKITSGENTFLLTGDLPKEQENLILDSGKNVSSKILKIAHHGSKYSTSSRFLEKVNPKEAIISVGKDNSYGHPNEEVINLLKEKNIGITRTDEVGDIIFKCKKDLICEKFP